MHRLILAISCTLLLPSCHWERTVYDENGNPVVESEPGKEKDLNDVIDARLKASFSERRNKDGVPEAASDRVSRYQKSLDAARRNDKTFLTGKYSGFDKSLDVRSQNFTGGGKTFDTDKRFDVDKLSPLKRDMRPDFLNEHKGLAHSNYQGPWGRSSLEGRGSHVAGRYFNTNESSYKPHTPSTYVQNREAKRPQPKIIDHRDQGKTTISETRHLLGRDE